MTGPKDVIIVIDISGSMGQGKRIEMAKEAVNTHLLHVVLKFPLCFRCSYNDMRDIDRR